MGQGARLGVACECADGVSALAEAHAAVQAQEADGAWPQPPLQQVECARERAEHYRLRRQRPRPRRLVLPASMRNQSIFLQPYAI